MPIDDETLAQIIEKYGDTIDLRANPAVLNEILADIGAQSPGSRVMEMRVAQGYGRTYYKGGEYTKEYTLYDKTVDGIMFGDLISKVRPEVLERYNPELIERYFDILDQLRARRV